MVDTAHSDFWPRLIALMDMNAFFASIEQADRPELRGKPVGVTNGLTGTCIITCSYEARNYGVHTGMRVQQAKKICPEFIQVAARPEHYATISTRIMAALHAITPDVEVFSVDEAFLDITRCQRYWNSSPERIGRMIKQCVWDACRLPCSVGLSGDKTTAKYAAKLKKPDGLTLIPPWTARERLQDVPVTELCGINQGIGGFLAQRGAYTCGDVAKLPISVLGQHFGNPGRRIWKMCRGEDPAKVETNVQAPRTIGHGKVMPPDTRGHDIIDTYLIHMAEKVAQRLRRNALVAQRYFIGLRTRDGWVGSNKLRTRFRTNDSRPIVELCRLILRRHWRGEGVFQVQITALDPLPEKGQMDLFSEDEAKGYRLNRVRDLINQRFGEFAVLPANLLRRSDMPNVIAPAWKPYGHRQTIPSTKGEKISWKEML